MPTGRTPLVSVLIPVYRGRATLARCVASLVAQTFAEWEAVIAIDDGDSGYPDLLARAGLSDPRLVFVSTGGIRSGVARARNRALGTSRGRIVAPLDADDTFAPDRLERLVPLALAHGAAADNVVIFEDASGRLLRTWLEPSDGVLELGAADLLDDPVPVLPLVDRRLGLGWVEVPICDDVVYNLLLLDRIGRLPVVRRPLRTYRQRPGSECNRADAVVRAEAGYRAVLSMLADGRLSLGTDLAHLVQSRFSTRLALNAAYGKARAEGFEGSYQAFIVARSTGSG